MPELDRAARAEQAQAFASAWTWYRERSTIARTLIKRGEVLIRMGPRKPKRGGAAGDEEDEVETPPVPGENPVRPQ